jgi:hypothetical protein
MDQYVEMVGREMSGGVYGNRDLLEGLRVVVYLQENIK